MNARLKREKLIDDARKLLKGEIEKNSKKEAFLALNTMAKSFHAETSAEFEKITEEIFAEDKDLEELFYAVVRIAMGGKAVADENLRNHILGS